MLLERIDKMTEVQNLLLDRLNIHNGSEALTLVSLQEALSCVNCSRFDHNKLDCPLMVIKGQGMLRQGPSGGPTQQGRPNYPGTYPNYYNTPVLNNPTHNAEFRRKNDQRYSPSYNGQQNHQHTTLIKGSRRLSRQRNHKLARKPHARPRRHPIRSVAQSCN